MSSDSLLFNLSAGLRELPLDTILLQQTSCAVMELDSRYPGIKGLDDPELHNLAAGLLQRHAAGVDFLRHELNPNAELDLLKLCSAAAALDWTSDQLDETNDDGEKVDLLLQATGYFFQIALTVEKFADTSLPEARTVYHPRTGALALNVDQTRMLVERYANMPLTNVFTKKIYIDIARKHAARMGLELEEMHIPALRILSISESETYDPELMKSMHRIRRLNDNDTLSWIDNMQKNRAEFVRTFTQTDGDNGMCGLYFGDDTICITEDQAYRLLSSRGMDQNDRRLQGIARAVIRHELTHAQGGLYHAVEEIRAEEYSGNLTGYQSEKRFFQNLARLGVYDIANHMLSLKAGGGLEPAKFYASMAGRVGLQHLSSLFYLTPDIYLGDDSSTIGQVQDMFGGRQGLLETIAKGHGKKVDSKSADNEYEVVEVDLPPTGYYEPETRIMK